MIMSKPMRSGIVIEDLQRMSDAHLPWRELDGKTVLVTGATGMLSSYVTWLLLRLHEQLDIGVTVVALCRNRQKAEQYYGQYVGKPYFTLLIQDVCEPIGYEGRTDYVFHLAGNASPHFINTDPVGVMKANLTGIMNVLELARRDGAKASPVESRLLLRLDTCLVTGAKTLPLPPAAAQGHLQGRLSAGQHRPG